MYPARYLIVTSLKVVNPAHSSLVLNPSVAHTALLLNFEYGVNQSSTVRNPSKPMFPSFGQDQYQLEPYYSASGGPHVDYAQTRGFHRSTTAKYALSDATSSVCLVTIK